jgi:hypothetical protein
MKPLNISEVGNGAIQELFNHEMAKVLHNIQDVNTDPRKLRSITIKVTFQPSADRNAAALDIDVTSKLANTLGAEATVFLGKDEEGNHGAFMVNPDQQQLKFPEPPRPSGNSVGGIDDEDDPE